MKRFIALFLIITILLINTSCANEKRISFNSNNALVVLHQLVDKGLYERNIGPDKDYYVFFSESGYKAFRNKYFPKQSKIANINFAKNDLLLINYKWGNKLTEPSYNVEGIFRKGNKIEVSIKNIGDSKVDSNDSSIAVEELIYIVLPKGTVKPSDVIQIYKK